MTLIIILVFLGVFVVIALLIAATGMGATKQDKQMLERLDSALATAGTSKSEMADLLVDVRKDDLLSSIPWIDRVLRRVELTPRLRKLLYQANLKWTVGGLMLMTLGAFVVPAYLIYLRTGTIMFGLGVGLLFGSLPLMFVMSKRSKRMRKFEEGLPEALELIVSALRVGHSLN
ncbi:MAG: type II secretion system F family protein, partial [Terriglobales bacterium]